MGAGWIKRRQVSLAFAGAPDAVSGTPWTVSSNLEYKFRIEEETLRSLTVPTIYSRVFQQSGCFEFSGGSNPCRKAKIIKFTSGMKRLALREEGCCWGLGYDESEVSPGLEHFRISG